MRLQLATRSAHRLPTGRSLQKPVFPVGCQGYSPTCFRVIDFSPQTRKRFWPGRLACPTYFLLRKERIIDSNPFSPPTTEVRDVAAVHSPHRPWHTWLVAGFTGIGGLLGIVGSSMLGIKLGLGVGLIYMLCFPGFCWLVLAYVIYSRSRHALATAIGLFVLIRLLGPLTLHFSRTSLGHRDELSYLKALTTQFSQTLWFDWVATGAILLYCAWDYRERFAGWLREAPEASCASAETATEAPSAEQA